MCAWLQEKCVCVVMNTLRFINELVSSKEKHYLAVLRNKKSCREILYWLRSYLDSFSDRKYRKFLLPLLISMMVSSEYNDHPTAFLARTCACHAPGFNFNLCWMLTKKIWIHINIFVLIFRFSYFFLEITYIQIPECSALFSWWIGLSDCQFFSCR